MTKIVLQKDISKIAEEAKKLITRHMAKQQGLNSPANRAHDLKQKIAAEVLAGATGTELAEEAGLRGMSERNFADLIIEKAAAARAENMRLETDRQRHHLAIDAMTTPKAIEEYLGALGIRPQPVRTR